jgi:N4-gp56 family major capsid protein
MLLKRATPNNILGQFGQTRTLPKKKTDTIKFRRYEALSAATTPLSEGVTPTGSTLTKTDVSVTLKQFGDYVTITDKIRDTHEDPVLNESLEILGEQAAETYDVLRAAILKAGTNVQYGNGSARTDVNTVIDATDLKVAVRTLKRQNAKKITSIVKAGPNIATNPIAGGFIAVCHPDLQRDLEGISGWIAEHNYASTQGLIEGEIGSVGEIRFVLDTNLSAWADAGDTKGATISTTGTDSDVYPVLIFAKNAYALVPLAGKNAVSTYVNNPKATDSDPLAQRGTVGWKGYHACVILNDNFMVRLEVAATS